MDFNPSTAESIAIVGQVAQGSPTLILPGGTINLGPFDVRGFSSYYLYVSSTVQGTATQFSTTMISLRWTSKLGSDELYDDSAEFFNDAIGGAFTTIGGPMLMQDAQHGPFVDGSIFNASATDTIGVSYTFAASTRQLPAPYFRQKNGLDGFLIRDSGAAIGAGVTVSRPLRYGHGRNRTRMQNNSAATAMSFAFFPGMDTALSEFVAVAAGANNVIANEFIWPKRAMLCQIANSGAAATYALHCTAQYDRQ